MSDNVNLADRVQRTRILSIAFVGGILVQLIAGLRYACSILGVLISFPGLAFLLFSQQL